MPIKDKKKYNEYMKDYMWKNSRGVIGYSFVVADMLHFGHLHFLNECKKHCDFLICGVYTDELTMSYKRKPIIPFHERIELIRNLRPVDMVVVVHNRSCIPMLTKLFDDGWKIKHLFHGTDWDPEKDRDLQASKEFIEAQGGSLIQPEYYEGRTTTSIIKEILRREKEGENVVGSQN